MNLTTKATETCVMVRISRWIVSTGHATIDADVALLRGAAECRTLLRRTPS